MGLQTDTASGSCVAVLSSLTRQCGLDVGVGGGRASVIQGCVDDVVGVPVGCKDYIQ